jgi:hypothetical protein
MSQTQFCIDFVLAALATWRVSHLLAYEDGPADLLVKLRVALGDSFPGKLMDCFKCLSIWIAFPAALFVTRNPLPGLFVWLALSGAACLLQGFREPAEFPQYQHPPAYTQTSQGEVSHVLWSEEIGSSEHSLPGEDNHPSGAAHQSSSGKQALNGAYRA